MTDEFMEYITKTGKLLGRSQALMEVCIGELEDLSGSITKETEYLISRLQQTIDEIGKL